MFRQLKNIIQNCSHFIRKVNDYSILYASGSNVYTSVLICFDMNYYAYITIYTVYKQQCINTFVEKYKKQIMGAYAEKVSLKLCPYSITLIAQS